MVLIPISGNIVGAFLAELLRRSCTTRHPLIWQKVSISSEIIALFIIGFLPVSLPNILINWFLSVNAGFQLSNFRSCEGTVHNYLYRKPTNSRAVPLYSSYNARKKCSHQIIPLCSCSVFIPHRCWVGRDRYIKVRGICIVDLLYWPCYYTVLNTTFHGQPNVKLINANTYRAIIVAYR